MQFVCCVHAFFGTDGITNTLLHFVSYKSPRSRVQYVIPHVIKRLSSSRVYEKDANSLRDYFAFNGFCFASLLPRIANILLSALSSLLVHSHSFSRTCLGLKSRWWWVNLEEGRDNFVANKEIKKRYTVVEHCKELHLIAATKWSLVGRRRSRRKVKGQGAGWVLEGGKLPTNSKWSEAAAAGCDLKTFRMMRCQVVNRKSYCSSAGLLLNFPSAIIHSLYPWTGSLFCSPR